MQPQLSELLCEPSSSLNSANMEDATIASLSHVNELVYFVKVEEKPIMHSSLFILDSICQSHTTTSYCCPCTRTVSLQLARRIGTRRVQKPVRRCVQHAVLCKYVRDIPSAPKRRSVTVQTEVGGLPCSGHKAAACRCYPACRT